MCGVLNLEDQILSLLTHTHTQLYRQTFTLTLLHTFTHFYSCTLTLTWKRQSKFRSDLWSGRNDISLCWDSPALTLLLSVTMWKKPKPHNSLKSCKWQAEKWEKTRSFLENLRRECPAFVRSRTFLVSLADFLFCCVLWEILLVLCGSPGLSLVHEDCDR